MYRYGKKIIVASKNSCAVGGKLFELGGTKSKNLFKAYAIRNSPNMILDHLKKLDCGFIT